MPEHGNYDVRLPAVEARGKPVYLTRHAYAGMTAERPAVRPQDVARVLEEPDHEAHGTAFKRIANRTIIVRYVEEEDRIRVRGVSATRRRLPSPLP